MARLSPERLALLRRDLFARGLGEPCAVPISRRAERATAPLSFAQERLYFLETLRPGTALHNDPLLLRIEGALDAARLRAALVALHARHEILRTSFELAGSGPRQRIHDEVVLDFRCVDLAGTVNTEGRALELVRSHARAPFALGAAPLARWLLVDLGDARALLVCTMHHLVSDGATFGILLRELADLYEGMPALAPARVQFGDYAAWERARVDPEREATDLAFWKRHLDGGPVALVWPGDTGTRTGEGAWASFALARQALGRLDALAREQSATHNHVLLAGWLAHLANVTGAQPVTTGLASSQRCRPELARLPGFFVQTLALRVELGDDPDFRTLLARTRTAALEAAAHADLPYDRVARALEPRGGPPLLQAYFSHMQDAIHAPRLGDASTAWELVDPGVARFDLSLVVHETEDELTGFLEFDCGAFTSARARELADGFAALVTAAVERPSMHPSELVPGGARRQRPVPSFALRTRRAAGGTA